MLRRPDSAFLGFAALLVSTGLLIAAVPATRVETSPAPFAVDFDCPYAELVIGSPGSSPGHSPAKAQQRRVGPRYGQPGK